MVNTIEKITKEQIPNLHYEGYLWFSNASQPEIIDGAFDYKKLSLLPFVVEGMLYSKEKGTSIRIVNIDGQYQIAKMDIPVMNENFTKEYFAKKHFGNNQRILMYEHWQEKTDPLNDNRLVLQPAWSAFIGFKK